MTDRPLPAETAETSSSENASNEARLVEQQTSSIKPLQRLSDDTCQKILDLRDARGWSAFHHPKDLAISISLEAAELLELFQWSGADAECLEKRDAMLEELADITTYAVLLADRLGTSLDDIVRRKLEKTAAKYPVESLSETEGLVRYEALKAQARADRARLAALQPVKDALGQLLDYATFLRTHPSGAWTSASDDRIYFVHYAPETVKIWSLIEKLAATFPKEALHEAIPKDLPSYPEASDLDPLSALTLLALLAKTVHDERCRDGAFLSATDSGVFSRIVAALAQKLETPTPV